MSIATTPLTADEFSALLTKERLRVWLAGLGPHTEAGRPCDCTRCAVARWVSDLLGLPLGLVNVSMERVHVFLPGWPTVATPAWLDHFISLHDRQQYDGCAWLTPAACLELLDEVERLVTT